MTDTAQRSTRLADAAIETLAESGMRGLTHRAVDRMAALPEGSCSNRFRTRRALLDATVQRLAELDAADVTSTVLDSADLDGVASVLAEVSHRWLTRDRTRMIARYELALEATRRPEIREALNAGGARFRAMATALYERLGVSDPATRAQAFVGCFDGLIFDHVAGAGAREPDIDHLRETFRGLLRGFAA
ncbi:TetR family transcriptional regulator [Nocardia nova]|uniref:TetR family transcriptional regulator n=1 Tax=Nocardia nova TaxID=37330 RepID=A0A2S6AWE5_9NOCA|nr:TetR/AcrR family transcriptional regulator [Nocardia nova]PPJ33709.1 TetR family transcriptional regulator [Nocardia nova]PPJ39504.1 TetR family transcriptional regulator [Nocardia nova]